MVHALTEVLTIDIYLCPDCFACETHVNMENKKVLILVIHNYQGGINVIAAQHFDTFTQWNLNCLKSEGV